ncbi:MAG: peptidase M14, partial [Flavobacterium sp.]|nr:peptidase M14 [Flavobacterium sp.]
MNYEQLFQDFKSSRLHGRYITLAHLAEFFADFPSDALHVLGYSVQNQPIYAVQMGEGKTKVLMWSQMHGNESTTTKALIDFISFLRADTTESKALLTQFQFLFLPILNPDGAKAYT